MVVIGISEKDARNAAKVARCVELLAMRLRNARVVNGLPLPSGEEGPVAAMRLRLRKPEWKKTTGNQLLVAIGALVDIAAVEPGTDVAAEPPKGAPSAQFEVVYEAIYGLAESADATAFADEHFEAFAKANAALNCWPYVRTQMHQVTSEAGVPLLLPLAKIQVQKPAASPEQPKA